MPTAVTPERLAQMQAQGYSGRYYDRNGQLQTMTNGQLAPAGGASTTGPATTPATTPPTSANPWATGSSGFDPTVPGATQTGPLQNYTGWAIQGGLNPSGWMGLGGPQNTDFLNMSHWTQGTADPGQITPTDPQSGFQSYIDNAYQQSTRQLDPQFAAAKTAFDQDMVNKGLTPGSAAYDTAYQNFQRSKEDAYANARGQAQQQGLAAQAQAFGQGAQQSQLASSLAQALIGANSQYAGQQLGGNASIMNSLLGGNQGIAQALLGATAAGSNARAASAAANANASNAYRLGMAQLNQAGQQQDFNNLMSMLNLGMGATQYNNGLLPMDMQRQQMMYGGMPSGNYGNIDVMSPYNNQYNGQMNQWNYGQQQANAQNQQYAQWAAMLASMYGGG